MPRALVSAGLLALGIAVGAVAARALWPERAPDGPDASRAGALPDGSGEPERAAGLAPAEEGRGPCTVPPPLTLSAPAASASRGETGLPPFAEGTAILRIGDAYVFGEERARAFGKAEEADVVCLDIRDGAILSCPLGVIAADMPLGAVGVPTRATAAAALLVDASGEFPERFAHLSAFPLAQRSGLAVVRSRAGKAVKVWLMEERGDPDALRRLVKIGYAEVPVAEGGGVLRVPTTFGLGAAATPTQLELQKFAAAAHAIPNEGFAHNLGGAYVKASELPATLSEDKSELRLLLDQPLRTRIDLGRGGGVFAAVGVEREGSIVLRGYSGVTVKGEMAGKIDVSSYACLYLAGDLTGEVDARSYTTIVIDGDLRGTLSVKSYVTLLLRGRLLGTLDVQGSCWSTFWFQGFHSQSEMAAMKGDFHQVTMHVEQSDAPNGEVKPPPGTFSKFIVGDPAWRRIHP